MYKKEDESVEKLIELRIVWIITMLALGIGGIARHVIDVTILKKRFNVTEKYRSAFE